MIKKNNKSILRKILDQIRNNQEALIILVLILIVLCFICTADSSELKTDKNSAIKVYNIDNGYQIIVEKETGICYLSGHNKLILMVDEDGKPKIYNESLDHFGDE